MRIFRDLVLTLAALAGLTVAAPAQSREGGRTDFAFELWSLNLQGKFIVIDPITAEHGLAPVQLPDSFPTPYSFAYDPARDVLWMIVTVNDAPILASFNPHTGETAYTAQLDTFVHSITYRRRDGLLYGFELQDDGQTAYVASIDPATGTEQRIVQIVPARIDWKQNYVLTNMPPTNLVFDPLDDVAYCGSEPETEAVLLKVDLQSGTTTLVGGMANSIALTFEPFSHALFGIYYNLGASGPPGFLWGPGGIFGGFPTPPLTSLAFVPHVSGSGD